jgi:hypothetical protein
VPAFYVPEGYVLFTLFTRQNTAFALPFDAGKLRATGEAIPVTDGVGPLANPGTMLYGIAGWRARVSQLGSHGFPAVIERMDNSLIGARRQVFLKEQLTGNAHPWLEAVPERVKGDDVISMSGARLDSSPSPESSTPNAS